MHTNGNHLLCVMALESMFMRVVSLDSKGVYGLKPFMNSVCALTTSLLS
jgi:hypothetical protein